MGRKPEYKPEFCELLETHFETGKSFASFGGTKEVSVSRKTLYEWLDKYPAFLEAKERGELKSLLWWEDMGIKGMFAPKEFSANLWIFNMKNRFKAYGWADQKELIAPSGIEVKQTTTIAELYSMDAAKRQKSKDAKDDID